MPWCPICKEEYKEGITTCPDCNVLLVESLEAAERADLQELIQIADATLTKKLVDYLEYSGIVVNCKKNSEKKTHVIYVMKKDIAKAKKHLSAFYSVESEKALSAQHTVSDGSEETLSDSDTVDSSNVETDCLSSTGCTTKNTASAPYENKGEKLRDLSSTLIVFSGFELLGIVVILLELLNITDFTSQIMMITLFLFTVVGIPLVLITTAKSYRSTKILAKEEAALTQSLNEWMESVFTKETICRILAGLRANSPEMPEEQLYLVLLSAMKKRVSDHFGALDPAYLDYVIDEFYDSHLSEGSDSL